MTTPGENDESSRADDLNPQNDSGPSADAQSALPPSAEQEQDFVLTFAEPPDQEETAEGLPTQSADAQADQDQAAEAQTGNEQDDLESPIPEDTKTCPEPHWIEIELRDEHNKPVGGVFADFIDSAGKKHKLAFSGRPVLLKNVAKGKGQLVFRRAMLYTRGLGLPQRPDGQSSEVEPKVPEKKAIKIPNALIF